jgi:hypothetical protein
MKYRSIMKYREERLVAYFKLHAHGCADGIHDSKSRLCFKLVTSKV